MPHECTNCGRTFPDGSKEMLSGCPDCGGNKFQFTPSRALSGESSGSDSASFPDSNSPDAGGDEAWADAGADGAQADVPTDSTGSDASNETADSKGNVARATETVREWVSARAEDDGDDVTAASDAPETEGSTAGSRPSADADSDSSRTLDTSDFDEWPETARRPEDRTANQPASPDRRPANDTDSQDRRPAGGQASPDSGPADRTSPTGRRETPDRDEAPTRAPMADSEDDAQADARSGVVSPNDLPTGTVEGTTDRPSDPAPGDRDSAPGNQDSALDDSAADDDHPPDHGRVVSEPTGDRPSIEELRAELNEQFESIKIVRPGEYELNLMELYNREEYIVSLQEDGRYVIEVPDSWRDGEE